nr:MAG TPA: Insulin-like 3 A chain, Insulin-like, Cleavage on pair of [Caudoviricetes sp.]
MCGGVRWAKEAKHFLIGLAILDVLLIMIERSL